MTITCGIGWADQHHDVAVLDHDGQSLARRSIDAGMSGFTELVGLLNRLSAIDAQLPLRLAKGGRL